MIGAIAGDIVGSPYEGRPHKSVDFPLLQPRNCFTGRAYPAPKV
jgi:hypothetical protein